MNSFALHLSPEALDQLAGRVIELLEERGILQPPEQANPYLDVDQAAALLKAKRQRVYDLVHAGKLPASPAARSTPNARR